MNLTYKQDHEKIYHLGMQRNFLLQSGYAETFGLERKEGESLAAMVSRIMNDTMMRDSNCLGT